MDLKKFFRSSKADFFKMLSNQADKNLQAMLALKDFMETNDLEKGKIVDVLESEADELRRLLIDELLRSFSTPIDREDIFALSRAIDDIIDYAQSTVDEMILFGVKSNEFLNEMVEHLIKGAREIDSSIHRLEKNPNIAAEHAVRAKATENAMEKVYRQAILKLFDETDVIHILKMREIYRHLSNAADRCDEAANIIGDIVVKMI